MKDFLQNAGLLVGLLSGVVVLAKGLLDLVKEFQANGAVVAALVASRRFWMATGAALLGTTLMVAGVLWHGQLLDDRVGPDALQQHYFFDHLPVVFPGEPAASQQTSA